MGPALLVLGLVLLSRRGEPAVPPAPKGVENAVGKTADDLTKLGKAVRDLYESFSK